MADFKLLAEWLQTNATKVKVAPPTKSISCHADIVKRYFPPPGDIAKVQKSPDLWAHAVLLNSRVYTSEMEAIKAGISPDGIRDELLRLISARIARCCDVIGEPGPPDHGRGTKSGTTEETYAVPNPTGLVLHRTPMNTFRPLQPYDETLSSATVTAAPVTLSSPHAFGLNTNDGMQRNDLGSSHPLRRVSAPPIILSPPTPNINRGCNPNPPPVGKKPAVPWSPVAIRALYEIILAEGNSITNDQIVTDPRCNFM